MAGAYQSSVDQLKRQQEILKVLGFYFGEIDGIWSTKTIEAKKAFERDVSFAPGISNGGLPFADSGPYPKQITLERGTEKLLHHPMLSLLTTPTLKHGLQVEKKAKQKPEES